MKAHFKFSSLLYLSNIYLLDDIGAQALVIRLFNERPGEILGREVPLPTYPSVSSEEEQKVRSTRDDRRKHVKQARRTDTYFEVLKENLSKVADSSSNFF